MQKPDGSYKSWETLSNAEQEAIVTEILNLVESLGTMSTSASAILSSLTTIYNIISPYTSDAAKAAKGDLEKATNQIQDMLNALRSANNGVKGIVNYMNAQPDIQFSQLDIAPAIPPTLMSPFTIPLLVHASVRPVVMVSISLSSTSSYNSSILKFSISTIR